MKKQYKLSITENHKIKKRIFFYGVPITLSQTLFKCQQFKSSENTVGKGEIVRKENFLSFSSSLKLSSVNTLSSEESNICRLGKG